MNKLTWKPGTMIYPLPAVMVSCGAAPEEYNIITLSWTGTVCTEPAMCYISVRPSRHSYEIIRKTGEYVINLTTSDLAFATDWCGVRSGRDYDKFREMNLTPQKAAEVNAPMIAESPVSIECRVKEIIKLGSHDMFLSDILAVNAAEEYFDSKTGLFRFNDAKPLCYSHGRYYLTGKYIGKFGFSVEKRKIKQRKG